MASTILPAATRNKFTGKEWDDDYGVNWLFFPARSYDPEIARWLVRDPLENLAPELSPYHYSRNNPVLLFDPDGKSDPLTISLFVARVAASLSTTLSSSNLGQALTTRINVPGKIDITVGEAVTSTVEQNLSKLPDQEQVVGALDQISTASGEATTGLSILTLVSTGTPLQPVAAAAAGVTGTIQVAADATKAAITGESSDIMKVATSIAADQAGRKVAKSISRLAGEEYQKLTEDTFKAATNIISERILSSTDSKKKEDDEKQQH